VKTNDEFGALGDSFNRMTESLRAAQEEVVRREKLALLGQLAGSVGNELRNPLGVMNNAVFFLKNLLPDDGETVREYLDIIKNEIDTSQRILTDFIDFFRTKAPRAMAIPAEELMAQSLDRRAIPENVEVSVDFPKTLPPLWVDPLQMRQAFRNLIDNAVQAMPMGGALKIAARWVRSEELEVRSTQEITSPLTPHSSQDFIEISVEDAGEGIAPENMEKLFQPLFTTKSRGIGLGLPICQNLVEANGGRIGVESTRGVGTNFTVMLPAEKSGP
jgi:signal transduction histidine kinase